MELKTIASLSLSASIILCIIAFLMWYFIYRSSLKNHFKSAVIFFVLFSATVIQTLVIKYAKKADTLAISAKAILTVITPTLLYAFVETSRLFTIHSNRTGLFEFLIPYTVIEFIVLSQMLKLSSSPVTKMEQGTFISLISTMLIGLFVAKQIENRSEDREIELLEESVFSEGIFV